jgi:hypothetical protein
LEATGVTQLINTENRFEKYQYIESRKTALSAHDQNTTQNKAKAARALQSRTDSNLACKLAHPWKFALAGAKVLQ